MRLVFNYNSNSNYLSIGVTHHSNEEVEKEDDEEGNEEKEMDLGYNGLYNDLILTKFVVHL